jgi:flagellar protein FliL
MAKEEKAEEQQEKPKSKMMLIIIIAVLVVLLLGGGITAFLMMGGDDDAEANVTTPTQQPAIYFDFKPPFIVNYQWQGRQRFVQVSLSVMTRKGSIVDAMQKHMPLIRNNLLMVFSAQEFEMLRTPEGKEALRQVVLEELQKILTEETGEPGVEQVLFTNFVMQ